MSRKIYIDCTDTILNQINTGIQRVERNIFKNSYIIQELLKINIQPTVYLKKSFFEVKKPGESSLHDYLLKVFLHLPTLNKFRLLAISILPGFKEPINKYWKSFNKVLLFFPLMIAMIPVVFLVLMFYSMGKFKKVKFEKNDVLFISGTSWWKKQFDFTAIKEIKKSGCFLVVLIHDIFPITHSSFFPLDNEFRKNFKYVYEYADLLIMNSIYTMSQVEVHLNEIGIESKSFNLEYFKMGFDLDLVSKNEKVRDSLKKIFYQNPPYISVGTLEPRKNYNFLLDAFDKLWSNNHQNVSLCIIGKYGWKADDVVERIKLHSKFNISLFWFDNLNDTELAYCYKKSKALVYPSIVEGFGLPLVEALSLKCHVFASDIAVFHEMGREYCTYFPLDNPQTLASYILDHMRNGSFPVEIPPLELFSWPNWQESTEELFKIIIEKIYHEK